MELKPHPKVYREIREFEPEVQEYIWSRLQELKEHPASGDDVDTIHVRGRAVFKYVMKEGARGGERDHRAVYDIENGVIRIFSVFHRDRGYDREEIARRF